ncbi:MAG: polymer-forming cytoskeletal protein [Candidatus Zixiibacteriota bacterium]
MKNKRYKGEGGLNTIIGKDSVIEGTLEVQGGLRIDGVVRGRVSATETVTVGDSGRIEAELTAAIAVIGGKVTGNVFAKEKIELQSKAAVEGDITTQNLIVQEGAMFHGKCTMKNSSTNAAHRIDGPKADPATERSK